MICESCKAEESMVPGTQVDDSPRGFVGGSQNLDKRHASQPLFAMTLALRRLATIAGFRTSRTNQVTGVLQVVEETLRMPEVATLSPAAAYLQDAKQLMNQRDWPAAAESCRRALFAGSATPEPFVLLHQICEQTGRPQESMSYLRQAVAIAPQDASLRLALGEALQRGGQSGAALAE